MKRFQMAGAFLVLLAFFSCNAMAVSDPYEASSTVPDPMARGEQYEHLATQKLQRGIQNFLMGWLEVGHGVKSEFYYRRQEYLPTGPDTFFIGLGKGIVGAFKRTAVGIFEIFTFPVPQKPVLEEMDEWFY